MQALKKLVILRGASGSGKSTLARELTRDSNDAVILSTDDFFWNPVSKNYDFNVPALPKAHYWNQMRARIAMESNTSLIVIDNTNLQAWEAKPYVMLGKEFDYDIEIVEPDTPWREDAEQLVTKSSHGVSIENLMTMLQKKETYTVKQAHKATLPTTSYFNLDEKEKKKVESNLRNRIEQSQQSTSTTTSTTSTSPASIRVEVAKNDGQKAMLKPIVIKNSDFEQFKKQACNALKVKYGKLNRVFTLQGEEIRAVSELKPNGQYVISDCNGGDFIPMALRKTAAERRAERVKKAEERDAEFLQQVSAKLQPRSSIGLRSLDKLPSGIACIVPPYLYHGSGRDAHSIEELQKHSITHVLNVAGDFPSSSFDGIQYRQMPLLDEDSALLEIHLEVSYSFIKSATQANGKVLVHCAVGKSRSIAIILAYLVQVCEKSLSDAFSLIKAIRPHANPNPGFTRQLMNLERRCKGTSQSTLSWDEVDSVYDSMQQWLERNRTASNQSHFSILWWEVLTKVKYHLHGSRRDEMFSEIAKALVVRGEKVKICEMVDSLHKLYIDLDIKMKAHNLTEQDVLSCLLPTIQAFIQEEQNQRYYESANNRWDVVVTFSSGKASSVTQPDAKWKFGFHLIWSNVVISPSNHKELLLSLTKKLQSLPTNNVLSQITELNEWNEIVDTNMDSLRLKSISCKSCQKKDMNKKKIKKKGKAKAKEGQDEKVCQFCDNTGLLDERIHTFLGVFDECGVLKQQLTRELQQDNAITGCRKRLELASVLHVTYDEISETPQESESTNRSIETLKDQADYSAVYIDLQDQVRLLELYPPSSDWIPCATHATLNIGSLLPSSGVLIGEKVEVKCVAIGKSSTNVAVQVEMKARTTNKIPHITISHSRSASAKDSNGITEWTPLEPDRQLILHGVVKEMRRWMPRTKDRPRAVPTPIVSSARTQDKELAVVEFLRRHGESALTKKYNIKAVKHQEHINLIQFSYGQTACDFSEPIVQECRGIILDAKQNWKVVAFPYKKFFNYGEKNAVALDWDTVVVSEKYDGSIAVLYHYKGKWYVSSSSVPDGSSAISKDMTFEQLFWDIWNTLQYRLPEDTTLTYIFELFSPRLPIVVKPQRETILLHGVRNNTTYEELDPLPIAKSQNWETISTFAFSSLEEVLDAARRLNPAEHEGFVVRDAEFRRVKVKSPQYVALAHLNLKGKLHINAKHMLQIVRTNEGDEFLVHFPEYGSLYQAVKITYESLLDDLTRFVFEDRDDEDDGSNPKKLYRLLQVLQEQGLATNSKQNADLPALKAMIRSTLSTLDDLDLLFKSLDLKGSIA
eukprot:TRINITY_DN8383_c0_g1_i2.p1 TRINITY_DN8383_c0_g1~~TRINITY_DN8383_c0_g1_i2.p1  ORF type:complete len:1314 (-),score=285.53 TRINITY_DN8383_c0_g1_i2:255-4196(-)